MQKNKIDILKNNSKFYKLDFGIDDKDNLDKTYLLIFLHYFLVFLELTFQLKKKF